MDWFSASEKTAFTVSFFFNSADDFRHKSGLFSTNCLWRTHVSGRTGILPFQAHRGMLSYFSHNQILEFACICILNKVVGEKFFIIEVLDKEYLVL
jgi:hypothetical protein